MHVNLCSFCDIFGGMCIVWLAHVSLRRRRVRPRGWVALQEERSNESTISKRCGTFFVGREVELHLAVLGGITRVALECAESTARHSLLLVCSSSPPAPSWWVSMVFSVPTWCLRFSCLRVSFNITDGKDLPREELLGTELWPTSSTLHENEIGGSVSPYLPPAKKGSPFLCTLPPHTRLTPNAADNIYSVDNKSPARPNMPHVPHSHQQRERDMQPGETVSRQQ